MHNCVALKEANDEYNEKLSSSKATSDKVLYQLCWSVDELARLLDEGRALYVEVTSLLEILNDDQRDEVRVNVGRRVTELQGRLVTFIRGVTRHQRHAATHILVTMISPSQRNQKPYALPLCCIPYSSLTEARTRAHLNEVVSEMNKRKMKVAGEWANHNNFIIIYLKLRQ